MNADISDKIDRAAAMMNLWDRQFVTHVRERATQGSEDYRVAQQSMREVGHWLVTSGIFGRDDRGDWVRKEGREVRRTSSLDEFEDRYGKMLEDHDRIAPDLNRAGFEQYVENFETARSEPLSVSFKEPEASRGALDDFLESAPTDQRKAMQEAGFTDEDMAGQYLIHAMLTSDDKEIDRILATGVNLGTPMSDKFSKSLSEDSPAGMHLSHYVALLGDNMPQSSLERITPEQSGLDKRDAEGNTPLHYAAMTSDEARLKAWIGKGSDPLARNAEGLSLSQTAAVYGATKNVAVLETAAREARMDTIRQAAERKTQSEVPAEVTKTASKNSASRDLEL